MTVYTRKKITRYRGSHTHGGGSKKKRRGAGNRGGRGQAGSGKRADQKKPSIIKKFGNEYYGKKGFGSKRKKLNLINISTLERKIPHLVEDKKITQEKDTFIIDLTSLGYDKLLGSGNITKQFKITTKKYSKNAKEKIEKIGGILIKEDGSNR